MHVDPLEEVFERLADGGHAEALERISQLIREEPYHGPLFAVRALILADLDRRPEAAADAATAVDLAPDSPFAHYVAAALALQAGEVHEAIGAARRARDLAPAYVEAALLEARARAALGQWQQVAELADQVLEDDPEFEEAAVLGTIARDVARKGPLDPAAWQDLATRFPLNPLARSGSGWTRLTSGQVRAARTEFEQALAIDPTLDWAKEGLATALKARFPLYSLLLRFFAWSGRMPVRTRNLMAIGGLVGYNLLRRLGNAVPSLEPFLIPVLVAYALFILSSWLADPLLNLCLMARAETRRLLQADTRRGALLVGACLSGALLLWIAGMALRWERGWQSALALAFLSLTVAAVFQEEPGARKRRRLAVFAVLGLVLSLATGVLPAGAAGTAFLLAIVVIVASTWYSRFARGEPA